MRNAETVLGIIHDRGKRGLPLEDVYRQLFNRDLFLRAYARLYRNKGALTPGSTGETVDGMSLAKIDGIIELIRQERYRWTPAKRVYIPKKSGKFRPLGLPSWSDKLLQEVMRSLLEAYYEPQFSDHSHGFRPGRGCHTALYTVRRWTGTRWFVEGDIAQCFDRLDHDVLLAILGEKVRDNRFLRLIASMLKAGYLEDWRWHATFSGSPQGGVVSPILSNIYLDRLDKFVETTLLPQYNRGDRRRINPMYARLTTDIATARRRGNFAAAHALRKQMRMLPGGDPADPAYRRLWYVRYADDTLFGFIGPKAEAEAIKRQLRDFLRDHLKLELSDEKTLITHARTDAARFLGYDIITQHSDTLLSRRGQRKVNGKVGLRVPVDVIDAACARYMKDNKPRERNALIAESDFSIVARFQAEYRGFVQYYLLATNVSWLNRLHFVTRMALLKTLAAKHKARVTAIVRKYAATVDTPHGPRVCLRVVVERGDGKQPLSAILGGIPLRHVREAVLTDTPAPLGSTRNDLLDRLLADTCEVCGRTGDCEVHHIRRLADLRRYGRKDKPAWVERMAARRRKTLVVCRACHLAVHGGRSGNQGSPG